MTVRLALGPCRLTRAVARAVEVHGEGAALVLRLPGGRGAVLVVGVGVVVVDVLAGEDGGARGAAHGRGHEGVDEVRPALLHDAPRLVHHLHGACNQQHRAGEGVGLGCDPSILTPRPQQAHLDSWTG